MFDVKKLDNAINSITDKIIEEQGKDVERIKALAVLLSAKGKLEKFSAFKEN